MRITGTCTTPVIDHFLRCVRMEGSWVKSWRTLSITQCTSYFSCRWVITFLRCARMEGSWEWRAGGRFPSHSVPATFHSKQCKARHPNGYIVPHYLSEGTRQRRLGKTGESTEVHKWDTIYEANPKCRRDELHRTLVRGRVASDQWRLQRISWMSNDDGEGSSYQFARHSEV